MTAQVGSAIVLGYRPQGVRQTGSAVLLSYSPPVLVQRRLMTGFNMPWVSANASATDIKVPSVESKNASTDAQARWGRGKPVAATARQPWVLSKKSETAAHAAWGQYLHRIALEPRLNWLLSHPRDRAMPSAWGEYARYLHLDPLMPWGLAKPADIEKINPWGEYTGRSIAEIHPSWSRANAVDRTRHLPWSRFSRPLDAGWGVIVPPGGIGPDEAFVIVPVKRTYVTINNIALRRVEGDVAIPTYAFQMALDVDSWTWSWSASVLADALALVQPGSDGEPIEVEALVNGVPYRLYAEGVSSQRQFGQARIAIKGRGKAAMLDAPYAPSLNFGNTQARTGQQLMTDVLMVNGVGIGWAVDWNLTDWLVPGNTWTHQGAYIGAVAAIAQAAGGYVQPHDTAQMLRILPRYPVAPWSWAAEVTPDFELPSDVVAVEGIDWTRKADYNRVFVSGVANGVLGQVTRAGTAGNSVAPMVTDALITHADAARQRGLAILSDTGQQARVTLTLPVLAETGLIKPGQFVRYLDGGQSRLGLVRSTSLAWSRPKLRQTIAVETHA
jgi:hypothetical protein